MANQASRRLVIDTNIARSAGESVDSISSACRRFLETVLDAGHCVVMTDPIRKEWHRHQSIFSTVWFGQMTEQEKVVEIADERDEILRKKIDASVSPEQRNLAAKDVHLIEAAIETDRLVTSNDEKVRSSYGNVANKVEELKQIVWVNPTLDEETPIDWLQNGARTEAHRMLGA